MKKYLSPETKSLQVNAQTIVCASDPAPSPGRSGELGTMTVKAISQWN